MSEMVTIESAAGQVSCYVATPEAAEDAAPGVLVLHAWWGLTDHFKRVCDRLASQGYVALAPDLFNGETADTPERAEELVKSSVAKDCFARVSAALKHLKGLAPGKTGLVGFSFGSAYAVWIAAVQPQDVDAVVPFYTDTDDDVYSVKAPMQWHFAETDEFVPDEWREQFRQHITKSGRRDVEMHIYPGTQHAFFNDDRPEVYAPEAARQAWDRTLALLRARLAAPR